MKYLWFHPNNLSINLNNQSLSSMRSKIINLPNKCARNRMTSFKVTSSFRYRIWNIRDAPVPGGWLISAIGSTGVVVWCCCCCCCEFGNFPDGVPAVCCPTEHVSTWTGIRGVTRSAHRTWYNLKRRRGETRYEIRGPRIGDQVIIQRATEQCWAECEASSTHFHPNKHQWAWQGQHKARFCLIWLLFLYSMNSSSSGLNVWLGVSKRKCRFNLHWIPIKFNLTVDSRD